MVGIYLRLRGLGKALEPDPFPLENTDVDV